MAFYYCLLIIFAINVEKFRVCATRVELRGSTTTAGESDEFVRLPLLLSSISSSSPPSTSPLKFVDNKFSTESQRFDEAESTTEGDNQFFPGILQALNFVESHEGESKDEEESVTTMSPLPTDEEDDLSETGKDDDGGGGDEFDEVDLIDFVQELERQADAQERTGMGMLPEILDIIHGNGPISSTQFPPLISPTILSRLYGNSSNDHEPMKTVTYTMGQGVVDLHPKPNHTSSQFEMSMNADGDLQLPSEDISEFSEEIIEGITAGIEESLRMSDDPELGDMSNLTSFPDNSSQTRQFSVYLFQGQYYAEPRLNRFIDGALRNMCTELRVASMDPLFFRVLPRGQVAEGDTPIVSLNPNSGRRRRPVTAARNIVKRQIPAFFRPARRNKPKRQNVKKIIRNNKRVKKVNNGLSFLSRRRQKQRLQQQRRRQQIRQQKLKKLRNKKRKEQQLKNKRKQNQKKKQQLLQRIRRRIRQDVGGGRIEGLSRVQRDGDAEMQIFGNYTLIRSHMKMGPMEITMQFRTKNGIRRSGATLPIIRAHTVTRVNHEGSEMIDYLLDRPHPETINVRGTIFPLAQKIARSIFARLFLPNSFLVQKLREKAGLAYLSRPVVKKKR